MAEIMFLLRERSEDGQIDQPVFVCESHSRTLLLASQYIRAEINEIVEDEGLAQSSAFVRVREQLEKSKSTPGCHEVIKVSEADRTYVLEAVLVQR